jgi:hypothetical protein
MLDFQSLNDFEDIKTALPLGKIGTFAFRWHASDWICSWTASIP